MKRKVFSLLMVLSIIFSSTIFTQNAFAAKIRGDLNSDGVVDVKDCNILRKNIAKILDDADEKQLDCNGDGVVDVNDTLAMYKYLVNIGELYYDREDSWINLIDWEGLEEGKLPTGVARVGVAAGATMVTRSLKGYNVVNDKCPGNTAVALVSSGLVKQNAANGTNPTTGQTPSSISFTTEDREKLKSATNLRVTLNMINSASEIDIIYIGCLMNNGKKYYHRITRENYSKFNYFYFAEKEFTEFSVKRRTYLSNDNPNKFIMTKDDVKNIRSIYFWLESDKANGNPLIIDDIDYYEGENGYDSSKEDAALPQPEEPVNDGTTKYISIAFDDGAQTYTEGSTKRSYMDYYLDLSKEFDVNYTFFLIGNQLDDSDIPALKRAVQEGNELQNHTQSHPYVTGFSDANTYLTQQIKPVDDWLNEKVGKDLGVDLTTTLLRPPFLSTNSNLYNFLDTGNKNGLCKIQACIAGYCPNDYDLTSVDYKVEYYKKNLKDGAIVLAHEHYIDNVETFRQVMTYFGKLGYKFVNITKMFEAKGVTPKLYKSLGNGILYYDVV